MLALWAIALWLFFCRITRLPWRIAGGVLGGFWLFLLALHLVAPGSQLAQLMGGNAAGWLVLGAVVGLVVVYRRLLRRLHGRVAPRPDLPLAVPDQLSEAELDRYARHILLPEIGGPGQMRLRQARVLVVGAGGLGAPVCLYLTAAGVGRITLADDDTVSRSNLQRQVIFRDDLRGEPKAYAAAQAMLALNPHLNITPLARRITETDGDLIAAHDLVIDGTDSFDVRAGLNRACVAAKVPLLSGAIGRWDGQVTLYDPARGGPCMRCLFPEPPIHDAPCAEAGVVGALPGVIGSIMALEVIKHLTGAGQGLRGRLLLFDGLAMESRTILTAPDAQCPVCGPEAAQPASAADASPSQTRPEPT